MSTELPTTEARMYRIADYVALSVGAHPEVDAETANAVDKRLVNLAFHSVDLTENDCDRLYAELHDLGVDPNAADQAVETVQIALYDGAF